MTDLRDAEEWAREIVRRAWTNRMDDEQVAAAITAAIHEARREMQEKCAIFCESHSPAWHSNELLPQRGSLTHDGHRYATAIRSIPIGDEEKNDD